MKCGLKRVTIIPMIIPLSGKGMAGGGGEFVTSPVGGVNFLLLPI